MEQQMTLGPALQAFTSVLSALEVTAGDGQPRGLDALVSMLSRARGDDAQCFLIGNGGSAAVCSHIQNDLVNKLRWRAHVLHEPSVMTCMSNDYGYPAAFASMVGRMGRRGDLLVAISSSGRSANMLAAVEAARTCGMQVLTLTGFGADNPLRATGDLNLWLPSSDYGEVEIGHLFVLHRLVDWMLGPSA
ncbi:SIS domain-containing protein [uncultured Xylophilus sp.]|uniref:SIS domain-containing protein n=1 Tax=uncultured Xylophilus sp. TaxID=296832 RepID=UPI0025D741C2|nr:SIS domain-containing protein [uncultured Xylophilus sp.]